MATDEVEDCGLEEVLAFQAWKLHTVCCREHYHINTGSGRFGDEILDITIIGEGNLMRVLRCTEAVEVQAFYITTNSILNRLFPMKIKLKNGSFANFGQGIINRFVMINNDVCLPNFPNFDRDASLVKSCRLCAMWKTFR